MSERQNPLERRYRLLLRAYPAPYRVERGDEIVGTYLAAVDPVRRWPSVADVADTLRGGVRQRLRASGAADLTHGVSTAATFALTAAVALAAHWLVGIEVHPVPSWIVDAGRLGPFQSLGAVVWIMWLVAGLAALTLPARGVRWFVLTAMAATVVVVPVAALSGYDRPPLLVLVPQVALGVLALGWPTHPGRMTRLTPTLVAAVAVLVGIGVVGASQLYREFDSAILAVSATVLLISSLLAGSARAFNGDSRGLWATLLLLLPAGLLAIDPLAQVVRFGNLSPAGGMPNGQVLALTSVTVTFSAVGALLLAIRLRRRQVREQPRHCPTCGRTRT